MTATIEAFGRVLIFSAVAILGGAAGALATGLGGARLARRFGRPFSIADGILFGTAGGLVGGFIATLFGQYAILGPAASGRLDALIGGSLSGLVMGCVGGAVSGVLRSWPASSAERRARARRDGAR
jgi:hypothetical protein